MGELAHLATIESDRLRKLALDEFLVVLGAVFFVDEGREHGFAAEIFLLGRRAHCSIGSLLRQVGLILGQCLVREDVERPTCNSFGICRCGPAMRSDVALEALPQGWQVYFRWQWIGDLLCGDYGLV